MLLLSACTGPSPEGAQPQFSSEIVARFPAAERVVALGDVHGDLTAMRRAMLLGGIIDEDDRWIGGDTVVVQTGDLLDRGDDERAIVDLMKTLQEEAEEAGGALHLLQGNHELMNVDLDFRYVTEAGLTDFDDIDGGRAGAFAPGGPYAQKLARHPVVLIVGDTAFAHGGVLPQWAEDIDGMNEDVAEWLLGNDDHGRYVLDEDDSPVWSRHYSDAPSNADCSKLDQALEILGVDYMVVGHTVQDHITSACDDRVWLVDVGMSAYYAGEPEVLELTPEAFYVLSY